MKNHNQFARRNLTEEMKAYLRGKRYEKEKERHGAECGGRGNQFNRKVVSGHFDHLAKTEEKLADEYDVGEKTIRRDSDFSVGVDAIAMDSPSEKPLKKCI